MALVCRLCKRDFEEAIVAFSSKNELKRIHTIAHLQDVVRGMKIVCTHVAAVGQVDREMTLLAQKLLGELEIIDGGLF